MFSWAIIIEVHCEELGGTGSASKKDVTMKLTILIVMLLLLIITKAY